MFYVVTTAVLLGPMLALVSVIFLRSEAKPRLTPEGCIHCGYSLKGILANAVCPECGKSQLSSAHQRRGDGSRWRLAFAIGPLLGTIITLRDADSATFLEGWLLLSVPLTLAVFAVMTVTLIPASFLSSSQIRVLMLSALLPTVIAMSVVAGFATGQQSHAAKTGDVIGGEMMLCFGSPIIGGATGFWALAVAAQVMRWRMIHR